jgi:hypothetical protein
MLNIYTGKALKYIIYLKIESHGSTASIATGYGLDD